MVLVQSKKDGPQRTAGDLDGFGLVRQLPSSLFGFLPDIHPPADRGGKDSNQMTSLNSWRWSLSHTSHLFRPFVSSRVHRDI
jgi:hypothetical protein